MNGTIGGHRGAARRMSGPGYRPHSSQEIHVYRSANQTKQGPGEDVPSAEAEPIWLAG